ncbi:uncharacterized protein ARMOST_12176 [Armillaria ostoyae]|uniref:SH3 domain-containing protein n=1 Tax=Armillaria ostoyae TaxID=47428 RepID=A0A284RJ65_ARMOS|nr:uncharacterized protein ARMOST_12176 [Armillaria ostoyae]
MTLLPILSSSSLSSHLSRQTVRKAYNTVFRKSPPAEERDNQILLWIQICCEVGVDHDIVKNARRLFPSLPDISQWNIAGRLLDLPLALQKHITVSKTIDVYEFMKRLGSEAELPGPCIGHTAELHRREQIVTAICHTLLSFVGFNLASQHKTSANKLELSQDATTCSRYLSYSIEPLEFDFALEVLDPGPHHLRPSVMVSIGWKRGSVDTAKQYVTWAFSSGTYLDESTTFPAQIDRLVDTGFKSMAMFGKFVQSMQECLLEPLWENIRDNDPDMGSTDLVSEQKALEEAEADLRKAELERAERWLGKMGCSQEQNDEEQVKIEGSAADLVGSRLREKSGFVAIIILYGIYACSLPDEGTERGLFFHFYDVRHFESRTTRIQEPGGGATVAVRHRLASLSGYLTINLPCNNDDELYALDDAHNDPLQYTKEELGIRTRHLYVRGLPLQALILPKFPSNITYLPSRLRAQSRLLRIHASFLEGDDAAFVQAKALWACDLDASDPDDLSFAAGDIITIVKETNADWWLGKHNGCKALFPANYVEKIVPAPASRNLPPAYVPPTGGRSVPPAPSEKKEYKPFMAAHSNANAPPPPGAGTNSVGLQQDPGQDGKKSKFGKYGNTMAHSAAGGVGFGAGAAIGGGLVRAIF